jgi:AcrR family transcriptional regulator
MVSRMPAEQRREQVLDAAVAAFAEGGYAGTTTDQVARRAGVSQPYVVRMFGTKAALFLAAHAKVMGQVRDAFTAAATPGAGKKQNAHEVAATYVQLVKDQNLLRVMQHGYSLGADPELGPAMREAMLQTVRQIREITGATIEETRDFLAMGMLINTLVSLQLPEYAGDDPDAAALIRCVLEPKGF